MIKRKNLNKIEVSGEGDRKNRKKMRWGLRMKNERSKPREVGRKKERARWRKYDRCEDSANW